MSTDNVFELFAQACRPPRRNPVLHVQYPEHPHIYHAILIRGDVSIGDLCSALRFSGIVVSTDSTSGQTIIHRAPSPGDAA